jgi:hypothetical protein
MKKLALVLVFIATPAFAQVGQQLVEPPVRSTPSSIGKLQDWEAFTVRETGETVCYAVSRPFTSIASIVERHKPMLTVVRRKDRQDVVTLTADPNYAGGTKVALRVGSTLYPFDPGPDGAVSRDGPALIAAMQRGLQAIARFEEPGGTQGTDSYSLRGFRAAFRAIRQACPVQ